MIARTRILIVGGYGKVGRLAAHRLIGLGYDVVIAGRSRARAKAAARDLGCRYEVIDLHDPSTWARAVPSHSAILCCVDQADTSFVQWAIDHGCDYVDITATDDFLIQVEALHATAARNGSTVVLSVGLAPGVSNLLAKACTEQLEDCAAIQIGLLLGLGEEHGEAAIRWTLETLGRTGRANALPRVSFSNRPRPCTAMPLAIADQYVVKRTLGIDHVQTVVTFESSLWTKVAAALAPLLRFRPIRRAVARMAHTLHFGSEDWAVTVTAMGARAGAERTVRASLAGRREAEATAKVAAETVRLVGSRGRPGVHHLSQLTDIDELAARDETLRPVYVLHGAEA